MKVPSFEFSFEGGAPHRPRPRRSLVPTSDPRIQSRSRKRWFPNRDKCEWSGTDWFVRCRLEAFRRFAFNWASQLRGP